MRPNFFSRIFRLINGGRTADDLVDVARHHFTQDLPNPSRTGCPSEATLAYMIRNGELPDNELVSHLLGCSECLKIYQRELIRRSPSQIVSGNSQDFLRNRRWRIAFVAAGVALMFVGSGFVGLWLVRSGRLSFSRRLAEEQPSVIPSPIIRPEPQPTNSQAQEKPVKGNPGGVRKLRTANTSNLMAINKVSIELDRYNRLRNGNQAEMSPIVLQRGNNQFNITLTSGSPKGVYTVSLADPFSTVIRSSNARSNDGVALRANLMLNSMEPGKYMICITRKKEVPDCISAIVNDK